jgi:hypothetical protein
MLLAAGSGLYLYQAKHHALMLDRKIDRILNQADAARERAGLLRAEYALLNDPSRLAELATQLLPDLQTTAPGQFTTMADLDRRLPPVGPAPDIAAPDAGTTDPNAGRTMAVTTPAPDTGAAAQPPALAAAAPVAAAGAPAVVALAASPAPRVDMPKPAVPKPDVPKPGVLKADVPKADASRPDVPKPDVRTVEVARAAPPHRTLAQILAAAQPRPALPLPTPLTQRAARPAPVPVAARMVPQRPPLRLAELPARVTPVAAFTPRPMVGSALGMARMMTQSAPMPGYAVTPGNSR